MPPSGGEIPEHDSHTVWVEAENEVDAEKKVRDALDDFAFTLGETKPRGF